MTTENTNSYKSPDKKYGFDFIFEGEIRFGPEYYSLNLNGKKIQHRIFGDVFKWNQESTFLALQEWLTTDYKNGPITALTLINLENNKIARISKADKGFISPIRFENGYIIFRKEYLATGENIESEIKLDDIKNWE